MKAYFKIAALFPVMKLNGSRPGSCNFLTNRLMCKLMRITPLGHTYQKRTQHRNPLGGIHL
nr:MAG TPA: hypothetical protein [Caudoviricetes sp.]